MESLANTLPENQLNQPCVLLVDDSRVVRKTIIKMLGPGFQIIEAGDGEAGWRLLTQNSLIDILVTDIDMPQLDGYSLICRIRAVEDAGLREIPIVVITGAEDDITRERAYACGANDFILKPIRAEQIHGCLETHLKEAARHSAAATPHEQEQLSDSVGKLPATDAALKTLRGPRAGSIKPFALDLALRIMPLLDYCNKNFGLGLDREILTLKRKILDARSQT